MAYRAPAFYFYNLLREVGESAITGEGGMDAPDKFPLYDSRQGELFFSDNSFTTSGQQRVNIATDSTSADHAAIDSVIISGHNLNLDSSNGSLFRMNTVDALGNPDIGSIISQFEILTPNGVPILAEGTAVAADNFIRCTFTIGNQTGAVVPEFSELWITAKRELVRGPEANWDHSWRRTQRTFENDAGVSATLLLGAARKTHRMTWRHLFGTDRQILLDMREQTSDWSQPFWFLPPDDIYPIQFVTIDRSDPTWVQDFLNPLESGTSDRVTLPMIEVLG